MVGTLGRQGREYTAYDQVWRVFGRTRLTFSVAALVLCILALRYGDRKRVWPLMFFAAAFGLVNAFSLAPGMSPPRKRQMEVASMVIGAGLCFSIVQAMGGVQGSFVFVFMISVFTYGFRIGRRAAYASAAIGSAIILVCIVTELSGGAQLSAMVGAFAVLFSLWPEAYCVEAMVQHESRWREELLQMAECDPLTGLPNRRTLQQALERSAVRAGQFALLLLDLDGFKAVNDEYGHLRGDEVLKSVAQTMVGALRRDDVVIRYGGDEFALLIEGSKAEAMRVFERLRASVAALGEEIGIPLGFSAGITVWPEDSDSLAELMQIADRRLYLEKQNVQTNNGSRRQNRNKNASTGDSGHA